MGMYVSELRSVPIGAFTYYLNLVDVSGSGEHSAAIAGALQELAVKSGTDALVVRGPANLSAELFQFLSANVTSDFGRLERLFHEVSSLVISKGALQTTNSEVFVVPLIVGGETGEKATPLLTELVAGLRWLERSRSMTVAAAPRCASGGSCRCTTCIWPRLKSHSRRTTGPAASRSERPWTVA